MRLALYVKLKYQSSTVILFVCIKYSMRDLLVDVNNCHFSLGKRLIKFKASQLWN